MLQALSHPYAPAPTKKPAQGGLEAGKAWDQTRGTGVPELTHSAMFSAFTAVL